LILIVPAFLFFVPLFYSFISSMMAFLLIWVSVFLILPEKNKFGVILVFLLSGFLGVASSGLNLENSLMPLLTGLFGSSTIISSINSRVSVPKQEINKISFRFREIVSPGIATAIVSPVCSFFPGLGSAQAAVIGGRFVKLSREQFLILLGSINTLVMGVSFVTLYLVGKTRTGSAVAILEVGGLDSSLIIFVGIVVLVSAGFSYFVTLYLGRIFALNVSRFNYSQISLWILAFVTILVFLISGFLGILVFIVSTFLGLFCTSIGVRKGFLMGALLIPTILFYLPV